MLQDTYYAEKHLLKALRKLAKKASNPELKQGFLDHHDETETHVERLETVFEMIGKRARGKTCDAIIGITAEADEIIEEVDDPEVLDAGIIGAAQAAEHYEISRYGTLKAWAEQMGLSDVVPILDKTLQEEKKADALLSKMAEGHINQTAIMEGGGERAGTARRGNGGRAAQR
jgi:ferritin-like metal-binding protein YciE